MLEHILFSWKGCLYLLGLSEKNILQYTDLSLSTGLTLRRMERIYPELALCGRENEFALTDTDFFPISEVSKGMVSLR